MSDTNKDFAPDHPRDPAAQLKRIGLIVMLTGLVVAALIFVAFPDAAASDENTLASPDQKKQDFDVQKLWGAEGSLSLRIQQSLRQPRTYSVIILLVSGLIGLTCFYLASHPPKPHEEKA